MNKTLENISISADSALDSCESLRILDNAPDRSKNRSMNHHATTTAKRSYRYDVTEFVHRGKQRIIYRRQPQGNFYARRQINNKPHEKSLDTPIAKAATLRAKAWLDEIDAAATTGKWERLDPLRSRSPWASIGEILERFTGSQLPASERQNLIRGRRVTARHLDGCASALRGLLQLATGETDTDQLRADRLTESTVRAFIAAARAAGRSESGIRSTLTQARCVIAPAIMHIYSDLRIPDLSGFRVVIRLDTGDDVGFSPIPPETEEAMETAARSLHAADPAVWLTYMLMSRLGMRNIEIERATIDWLRPDETGTWHLHIPATKGGLARALALPPDLTHTEIHQIAGTGPHIIPARNPTERRDICQRQINRFVTRYLPDRTKCAYELRKWAGSLVWSTQTPAAAQAFLGHRSIATTERYYARFLRPVRAVTAADRAAIRTAADARGAA